MNPQLFRTAPSYAECFYSNKEHSSKNKHFLKICYYYFFDCQKKEKRMNSLLLSVLFWQKYLVLVVSKEREKPNSSQAI